jgi:hypothetical protein
MLKLPPDVEQLWWLLNLLLLWLLWEQQLWLLVQL